ncbi:MAG: thioredoxin-disulfide reductase [Candidatus Omnitrophota bacterium]|jgi:thioredoxin reductase (NADPH)
MDYDVIIIGGGPSGLTAAIYTSRARLKTLIIESYSVACQAVTTDLIENYPGFPEGINGFELIDKFKKQAEKFGAGFIADAVKSVKALEQGFEIETEEKAYACSSVILASGASPKMLNVPGEEKLRGKGVSYCATCDGALFKDKEVVLVGGGDTALEEALFLTRFVKKVSVVHRRNALRGARILQERAFINKKIEFVLESVVTEITGADKVSGVRIKDVKTGALKDLACEGVFIFVGYTPNTDFLKDIVSLDEPGYIITDDNCLTSKPGIFAAGDCRKKTLRQVVTAAGDGATAAFSCQNYLEKL